MGDRSRDGGSRGAEEESQEVHSPSNQEEQLSSSGTVLHLRGSSIFPSP